MTTLDLDKLLSRLRRTGGDTAEIEVKSSAGGLPRTITATLCAMANLPGGGWVVLGLDERNGFAPVQLPDLQTLKQGLIGKARACVPPVQVTIEQAQVDGLPVVLAYVAECTPSAKPCRIKSTGQGWLRGWDGDFMMSELEEQAFLAQREPPRFDRASVEGAQRADLDDALVELWSRTAADLDPRGLGRFSGEEMLFRAGIVSAEGVPTKAGLLALGVHPQQFFPRYVVNLSATAPDGAGERAREVMTASGPIPTMLESTLDWARKAFARSVRADAGGAVRDEWQFPLEAFRELIGNALVHRDLDSWSDSLAVEVRLTPAQLVVTNPGGLYGLTVDRLGLEGTTSARNGRLIEICRYTRAADGARVVETLASGIPRVFGALDAQGLPPARFQDSGVRFTALLRTSTVDPVAAPVLNESQRAVFAALIHGEATVAALEVTTGLRGPTIRKALRSLAQKGMTEQQGGRGQTTVYRRMELS